MAYIPTITDILDVDPSPNDPDLLDITVATPAGPMKARIATAAVRELSRRIERLMAGTGATTAGIRDS
jgi:hypothetical protein